MIDVELNECYVKLNELLEQIDKTKILYDDKMKLYGEIRNEIITRMISETKKHKRQMDIVEESMALFQKGGKQVDPEIYKALLEAKNAKVSDLEEKEGLDVFIEVKDNQSEPEFTEPNFVLVEEKNFEAEDAIDQSPQIFEPNFILVEREEEKTVEKDSNPLEAFKQRMDQVYKEYEEKKESFIDEDFTIEQEVEEIEDEDFVEEYFAIEFTEEEEAAIEKYVDFFTRKNIEDPMIMIDPIKPNATQTAIRHTELLTEAAKRYMASKEMSR